MQLPTVPQALQPILDQSPGKFVTFGMMARESITIPFDKCVDDMLVYSAQHGFKTLVNRVQATDVERGRYDVVRQGFYGDWLLWIDCDQTFPPDVLVRLASHDLPIVGTIITAKQPPHFVVAGMGNAKDGMRPILDWPKNALIEVDAVGFGVTLIKREVLEAFPDGNPFLKVFCESTKDNFGEDWSFCLRAKELGFPIYVDTSIPIGHVGSYIYTFRDYELYKDMALDGGRGTPFYEQCKNPKVFRRLAEHGKMRNLIEPITNGKMVKPKNRLILMGER